MSAVEIHNFKLGYREAGINNQGIAPVFLHGVGSDKSVWDQQLQHFGQTRRAIAFDYPGYNESDLPDNDSDRQKVAAALLEALEFLKVKKAHFCGLSMGGVIALEIYQQQPEKVASLILANTFAKHPHGNAMVERSLKFIENNSMRQFAEQRVDSLLAPNASAATRRQVVETMARIDKRTYRWSSQAVWTADYLALLPKIKVPTLVIGAAFDQPTPPNLSQELAAKIPNAKLKIIPNAGHLSNLDQPETFNRLIENFIKENQT